ncbi:FtsB family cell division protein [Enterovirga aerilata]|uniref:Septum formation initiator family protein n=1 Tax=Enterovirga aerilata TaxID=2730920 RepID=A0A849I7F5_9HYPH|nr:septum formation initiator family protein [Enterovirga sp. DB1703]NNM71957.1 septum formation initiator family protein [Enterovirga sp. DB1703]
MVVRRRFRAFLIPLALYAVAAAAVGYFVHNAQVGNRGLAAKRALKTQVFELRGELEAVQAEHAAWDRRLALLRSDQVDRDLLEERARVMLGRVHRNDLVIVQPLSAEP